MRIVRARFVVTMKHCAMVCAASLLSVVCAAASPVTIGTFELQNDSTDPFFTGPTFLVTNDSALAGYAATFGDIHLLFGLDDLSTLDFALTGVLGSGGSIDSNGLTDVLGQSLLPDLGSVISAYLTLTLVDAITHAVLPGSLSFAPTNPPLCGNCTNRMTDFTHGSTLAIQFDPAVPGDASPIPEPMSLLLVGSGLAACAAKKRWRSR